MFTVMVFSACLMVAGEVPATSSIGGSSEPPVLWRVEQVKGPDGKTEIHVVRGDGSSVKVGEGLQLINGVHRLKMRAKNANNPERSVKVLLGRGLAVGAGAVVTAAGLVGALLGAGFWAWNNAGLPDDLEAREVAVIKRGPPLFIAGVMAFIAGCVMMAGGGAAWVWLFTRPPPDPKPEAVKALSDSLSWDEQDARDVVAAQNAKSNAPAQP